MSIDWLKDKLSHQNGRNIESAAKISSLTFETFPAFADAYVDETFKLAFKATSHALEAEKLSVSTLCRVLTNESVAPNAENTLPMDAIMHAMESQLNKPQISALHNESVTVSTDKIYGPAIGMDICERAVEKASSEMPRYAPVFSGTAGTAVILLIVAAIIAAVALIWLMPTGKTTDEASQLDDVTVEPLSRINGSFLVDISASPVYADDSGAAFTTGGVPVIVELSGPDLLNVDSINVTDRDGNIAPFYQFDKHSYCFIASRNDIYTIAVNSAYGSCVKGYADLLDVPVLSGSDAGLLLLSNHFPVTHNGTSNITVMSLADSSVPVASAGSNIIDDFNGDTELPDSGNDSAELSGSDIGAEPDFGEDPFKYDNPFFETPESESEEEAIEVPVEIPIDYGSLNINIAKQGTKGTLEHSDDPRVLMYTPNAGSDCIGIDSIVLDVTDVFGDRSEYTIPVIICNNAPVPDKSSLSVNIKHTPSRSGLLSSKLYASDADGDHLRFDLVSSENCSVMLSPGGGYIARVGRDFNGESAGFSFTVSDGAITTDPINVTLNLSNNLIEATVLEADYVCYAGENGNYVLDLPRIDDDGDPLKWSIVTSLNAGIYTPEGSAVKVSDDGSEVTYCIDPERDGQFRESIELRCSDGWRTSETITYICNVFPNKAPAAGNENTASTTGTQSVVCEISLAPDDCIFDSPFTYEITSVRSVVGGSVTPGLGWDTLCFTFTPDGSETECSADLLVTDTVSGKSNSIHFTIIIG